MVNNILRCSLNFSQILHKKYFNLHVHKWKRLVNNYNLYYKNISFTENVFGPRYSKQLTIYQLKTFFLKTTESRYDKRFRFSRYIIFFKTRSLRVFRSNLRYLDFTRKNLFYPLFTFFQTLWRVHDLYKYSPLIGDDSLESGVFYENLAVKNLNKLIISRWRFFNFERIWSRWRHTFSQKLNSFKTFLVLYKYLGVLTIYALQQKVLQFSSLDYNIPYFKLYWTFTKTHRLYLNMQGKRDSSYNYFSLFPGFFLKFYKNRRPLKRTKLFKILLVKFLRKVLVSTNIRFIQIIVNRAPTFFTELYRLLITPSIVPYRLPNKISLYQDSFNNINQSPFQIKKFLFLRTKFYGLFKEKRRGRLKRKVARRLFKKNNVMD